MNAREVAEWIARDATCAQGEFHARVNSMIPYLTEYADEIERLRAALLQICGNGWSRIELDSPGAERGAMIVGEMQRIAREALSHEQTGDGNG